MDAETILGDLVAIDSSSHKSNGEIIQYLEMKASSLGFQCERFSYQDERGVQKTNLVCRAGHKANEYAIQLALVGHTDTVPYSPDWTDALKLTRKDLQLFGRGSCDTKGFISAALVAVSRIDHSDLKKPLAIIFTADEEVGCIGAKVLADNSELRIRNAIVGEPTSLRPMRAGKGYCLAEVSVRGREGHSAYPAVGSSAIFAATALINRIEGIARDLEGASHPDFDPPFTTLNIGIVNGGTAKNIIPGHCNFTLEWRPVPNQPADEVLNVVRRAAVHEAENRPGIEIEVNALRLDGGVETPSNTDLVKYLEEITGQKAGTIAFGTEAPQMFEMGAEAAVVLGPGDIRVAHRTGEFVPVDELHRCADVLQSAVRRFCVTA